MSAETARPAANTQVEERTEELFRERCEANFRRTDRMFAWLMIGQWVFGVALALWFSPQAWQGKVASWHAHVPLAIFLGAAISSFPLVLIKLRPGAAVTRYSIGVAQMLWSALLIHLSGGRIETHFHVFGSLAFLAFYRDWKVLVPATVVVAADHLIRQLVWPESVYGILAPEAWRFLEHSFWVVFEDLFLVVSIVAAVRETRSIAGQQARIELTEQLEQEMEIAARIQTAILPRSAEVAGLDVAATMVPASEVGGDYYDVIPVAGGGWIAIGDVAGHGLVAGLVMLQAQSATKALVLQDPNRSPRDILVDVNRVIFDNVRQRLRQEEHMTMSLVRYHDDGRIVVAGAHQSLVICRAATGRCERHDIRGTWIGLVEDIRAFTVETTHRLEQEDLLVLYTDGVTEAMSVTEEQFGLARLCTEVERVHAEPATRIRDHLLETVERWAGARPDDDLTVLVLRHRGLRHAVAA
jgi:serine phosphatase RsbU (regulator of sigma subunit)